MGTFEPTRQSVAYPVQMEAVSYEFLSHLVAEYLIANAPDVDVSAALSILPYTQKGMDLNPVFTSPLEFNPAGDGKEMILFDQANMKLVHGWLVDPDSTEAKTVSEAQDYDNATILIAEADHITNGQLVVDENGNGSSQQAGSSSGSSHANGHITWSEEQRNKIEKAVTIRRFLDITWSQFTYHGLFALSAVLEPGSLVALFRSSHLSVLYKSTAEVDSNGPALYTLVTDQAFLNEPSVIWERLDDVDFGSSIFVDSDFIKSSPAGGDFAGQTAEDAFLIAQELDGANDLALARQLQQEEDDLARRQREAHLRKKAQQEQEIAAERERKIREREEEIKSKKLKGLKKPDCVIM
ncbi:hypothetical protein AX15_004619 [Amanita polypyramis BW_CC]|nr:hypothetical protein AX15_004619 [Amanita polypyramis BW_CC]